MGTRADLESVVRGAIFMLPRHGRTDCSELVGWVDGSANEWINDSTDTSRYVNVRKLLT